MRERGSVLHFTRARAKPGAAGWRGAAKTEYIVIVIGVAILCLGVVTAFGRNIVRRFMGASKALDEGRPNSGGLYDLGNVAALNAIPPINAVGNLANITPSANALVAPGAGAPAPLGNAPHYGGGTIGNPTGWDPEEILRDLMQVDRRADTVFDPQRCTRTSHLAAAVMCGPGAVQRIIDDLAREIQAGRQPFPQVPGGPVPISPAQALRDLSRIRSRLDSQSFDQNDSGRLLEVMSHYHQAQGASNTVVGLWPSGMNNELGQPLGNPQSRPITQGPMTQAQWQAVVNGLQPGEAIRHVIEWPGPGAGAIPTNHTTLIGRDRDGRLYAFDPAPKAPGQSQIVYSDTNPDQFNFYLNNTGTNGSYYASGYDDLGAAAGGNGAVSNAIRFCGGNS